MPAYRDLSKEELLEEKASLEAKFQEVKEKGMKLDMTRGKPSAAQLDLAMGMMDVLNLSLIHICGDIARRRRKWKT